MPTRTEALPSVLLKGCGVLLFMFGLTTIYGRAIFGPSSSKNRLRIVAPLLFCSRRRARSHPLSGRKPCWRGEGTSLCCQYYCLRLTIHMPPPHNALPLEGTSIPSHN